MFSLLGEDVINDNASLLPSRLIAPFHPHPIANNKLSKNHRKSLPQLDPILQILDRSTDIFEVLFVGSAVKYLFNEKPHILGGIK